MYDNIRKDLIQHSQKTYWAASINFFKGQRNNVFVNNDLVTVQMSCFSGLFVGLIKLIFILFLLKHGNLIQYNLHDCPHIGKLVPQNLCLNMYNELKKIVIV